MKKSVLVKTLEFEGYKMPLSSRGSLITHPDAILFLRFWRERVFQQPRDFSSIIGASNPCRSDMDLSRGSFPRPQNQNYEDYNCQDTGHNPNPSNVIHDFSPFSGVCSCCRKGNSPEGGGSDVLFHKLNSIPEKTLLGIDLGYDPR